MFCIRFVSVLSESRFFKHSVSLKTNTCNDVFQFVTSEDKHDFEIMVATLCSVNHIGIAIEIEDIKLTASSEVQMQNFLNNFYDLMDTGISCVACKIWSFTLQGTDQSLIYFIGDRTGEQTWIHDNLMLRNRTKMSVQ